MTKIKLVLMVLFAVSTPLSGAYASGPEFVVAKGFASFQTPQLEEQDLLIRADLETRKEVEQYLKQVLGEVCCDFNGKWCCGPKCYCE